MKVTLATHGGLAAAINLRLPPQVVDTGALPDSVAQELTQLVAQAKAAAMGRTHSDEEPRPARDEMSYTITIDDGDRQLVLTESDTTMSPEFATLLDYLQRHTTP